MLISASLQNNLSEKKNAAGYVKLCVYLDKNHKEFFFLKYLFARIYSKYNFKLTEIKISNLEEIEFFKKKKKNHINNKLKNIFNFNVSSG